MASVESLQNNQKEEEGGVVPKTKQLHRGISMGTAQTASREIMYNTELSGDVKTGRGKLLPRDDIFSLISFHFLNLESFLLLAP